MKILSLKFIAFGMLKGVTLDLNHGNHGLHIVYGLNEAGKSTALRAVQGLLFGIPERTSDSFAVPTASLRIGGALRFSDGTELHFVRRKGRVNTLRAADDSTIADEPGLKAALGYSQDQFERMFGIDHEELVRGGSQIVQGQGEVGELLFSAGTGISGMRRIQTELQTEANDLYAPRASTRTINKLLSQYETDRKALARNSLSGDVWTQCYESASKAKTELLETQNLLSERAAEKSKLSRIKAALAPISLLIRSREGLARVREAVILSADFGQRRSQAVERRLISSEKALGAEASAKQLQEKLEALHVDEALVTSAEEIEQLHQAHGAYIRDEGDLPNLNTQIKALDLEIREHLQIVRPGTDYECIESIWLTSSEEARAVALGQQYNSIIQEVDTYTQHVRRQEELLEDLKDRLESTENPPDTGILGEVLQRHELQRDPEHTLTILNGDITDTNNLISTELSRLPHWSHSEDELFVAPIPAMDTIDDFDRRFDTEIQKLDTVVSAISSAESEVLRLNTDIEKLMLAVNVPTEVELANLRDRRDQGWQLVVRSWRDREPLDTETNAFIQEYAPEKDLTEAFPASVRTADTASDRMRHEASSVSLKAQLVADLSRMTLQRKELEAARKCSEERVQALHREWTVLWEPCDITPGTPREMRSWHQSYDSLITHINTRNTQQKKAREIKSTIVSLTSELRSALKSVGQDICAEDVALTALADQAKQLIREAAEVSQQIASLNTEFSEAKVSLKSLQEAKRVAEDKQMRWNEGWREMTARVGLKTSALPEEVNGVVTGIRDLYSKYRDKNTLAGRKSGILARSQTFRDHAAALVARLSSDLINEDMSVAVKELNARLTKARQEKSLYETLSHAKSEQEELLKKAREDVSEAVGLLKTLCTEAKCADPEELAEAEQLSNRRKELESEVDRLEKQILPLCGGTVLSEFMSDCSTVDPDTIDARINALEVEIERLDKQKDELNQTVAREQLRLDDMGRESPTLEIEQHIQSAVAALQPHVERYVRLSFAAKLLKRTIDRYRERNKDPLLTRASSLFNRITKNRYLRLETEQDERGDMMLTAIRNDGTAVEVDGLSDGTADQLYLALRLAGVEAEIALHEPMPLLLDDVCIQFDDERALSTLEVLAEISSQTQVIFFTHHKRIVELATAGLQSDICFQHELK